MKILVIDNYDSFVYNIVQTLGQFKTEPIVIRNDKISISSISRMDPDAIIISPGPGNPADRKRFGVCTDVITQLGSRIPILGICLGHQGIFNAFGGKVINAKETRHGKTSMIMHNSGRLYENVSNPFKATRYHSLVVDSKKIPNCLEVTAKSVDDGVIMGARHKRYLIEAVQFHPESVLTGEGPQIFLNFLSLVKR
jgi:anthranilate synthase component 2